MRSTASRIFLICALLLGASSASAWFETYGYSDAWEEPVDMATDPAGNLYVVGVSRVCPVYCGAPWDWNERWWFVVKYDAGGTVQWHRYHDLGGNPAFIAAGPVSIEADAAGAVYVTGFSQTDWRWGQFDQIPVVSWKTEKYDTDGNYLWDMPFNLNFSGKDAYPRDLSLDASGDVYVTGTSYDAADAPGAYVVKYDGSTGAQLWYSNVQALDGISPDRIDAGGSSFVVAGAKYNCPGSTSGDIGVAKYDLDGNLLWIDCYDRTGSDSVNDLLVDGLEGDVYVAGSCQHPDQINYGWEFCTLKYDASGSRLWARQFMVSSAWSSSAIALDVDGLGHVYVAGSASVALSGSLAYWALVKYDAGGDILWSATWGGFEPSAWDNNPTDIAVERDSGLVWLAGITTRATTYQDQAFVVYSETGALLMEDFYDSGHGTSGADFDSLVKVGATPSPTVYIAGVAGEYPDNNRYMTVQGWSLASAYSGAPCWWEIDCFDGVFCNGREWCEGGFCAPSVPETCSDGVACTVDSCNAGLDACVHAPSNAACGDGVFCNGSETCDPSSGCVPGSLPACSDGIFCNGAEFCDAGTDACYSPDVNPCDPANQYCDENGGSCWAMPPGFMVQVFVDPGFGGWVSTGVQVQSGGLLTIMATGWVSDGQGGQCSPDGCLGVLCGPGCPLPDSPLGALIGRIGPGGAPFLVGTFFGQPVSETGELFLAVNNNNLIAASLEGYFSVGVHHDQRPTGIDLTSFTATGAVGRIDLTWVTATETDNAGFHLWRSKFEGGPYARITTALIPSEGSPTGGATYSFADDGVTAGKTYWYKLEDIDINGNSTFHGPVNGTVLREPLIGCGVTGGADGSLAGLLILVGLVIAGRATRKR